MRNAVGEHCPWNAIVSSTLSRCAAFASELAQRHALPLEFDARLMEIGFGEWEGRTAEQVTAQDPALLRRFWLDPLNNVPPGAELLTAFRDRVIPAWDEILARHSGKHILNAGITRIRVESDGEQTLPTLLFHAGAL